MVRLLAARDLQNWTAWHCQLGAKEAKLPWAQPSSQFTSAYECNAGHIAPRAEGMLTRSPVLTGGKAMTAELEVVVDQTVGEKKLLGMPG
jgi:hypothetical protein